MSLRCNLACEVGGELRQEKLRGDEQSFVCGLLGVWPVHRCHGAELGPPPQSSSNLQQTALTPTLIICRQSSSLCPPQRVSEGTTPRCRCLLRDWSGHSRTCLPLFLLLLCSFRPLTSPPSSSSPFSTFQSSWLHLYCLTLPHTWPHTNSGFL